MRYGSFLLLWPIHYLSMSELESVRQLCLPLPLAAAASSSLFAFCQNGNEENLHGRCICGIFPSGRGRSRRTDGRGRLGVRMSFLIISVFAFFAFALFLVHLCTLFTPLPLPLSPGCHLSCIFMRISKSPVQVLRESCAHLLRAAI